MNKPVFKTTSKTPGPAELRRRVRGRRVRLQGGRPRHRDVHRARGRVEILKDLQGESAPARRAREGGLLRRDVGARGPAAHRLRAGRRRTSSCCMINGSTFDQMLRSEPGDRGAHDAQAVAPAARDRQHAARRRSAGRPPRPMVEMPAPQEPTSAVARPQRLVHVKSGMEFFLSLGPETMIGRTDPVTGINPDIDLTPVDTQRSISRRHAKIYRRGGKYFLAEEIGTMNGTFVNGTRLETGVPAEIKPGRRSALRPGRPPVPRRVTAGAPPSGRPLRRDTPLRYLRGVGPAKAEKLRLAGHETVGDLLWHLPSRYEDRRRVVSPREVDAPGDWTVTGRLAELRLIRTRRRGFVIVRGRLEGEGGAVALTWFNQPYLLQRFADGDRVLLHGAARASGPALLELVNPTVEKLAGEAPASGGIVPIYPSLGGLGPAATARCVGAALECLRDDPPPDPLPEELRKRYAFPGLAAAFRSLHHPAPEADLAALDAHVSPSHHRLVYDELLESAARARRAAAPRDPRGQAAPLPDRRPGARGGARHPAVRAHRGAEAGDARDRRRPQEPAPDAPPAAGGRRQRQDDRRRAGAPARRRERPAGRLHGADRAARRAALRQPADACSATRCRLGLFTASAASRESRRAPWRRERSRSRSAPTR